MNEELRDAKADLSACETSSKGPLRSQWGSTAPLPHKVWSEEGVIARCYREEDARLLAIANVALPYWITRATSLQCELDGVKKSLALMNAGMESQCELMDNLKQKLRIAESEVRRLNDALDGKY
jgi:hypothetical protein